MPRPRSAENAGLPEGWRYRYGAYYWQVPERLRHLFDGKVEQRLGTTLDGALEFAGKMLAGKSEQIDDLSGMTQDDVIAKSVSATNDPCVYFLIRSGEVVYVGQSMSPFVRVSNHRDKDFDSVTFLPVPAELLTVVEARYIRKFSPQYNQCAQKLRGTAVQSDRG